LTYATSRGHALIGRALYLPEGCAADEEHRELAGVPEEVLFATKPQLAAALLEHAQSLGTRAAFVAGDEVYGGREPRRGIRQRGMGYVLAVRASHTVTTGSGRTVTAAEATDPPCQGSRQASVDIELTRLPSRYAPGDTHGHHQTEPSSEFTTVE
jgi:SRSO17 transposase